MGDERGQATIEWTGLVLLVSVLLGGAVVVRPHVDGRSFGGFLAHRMVCAVRRGCDDGQGQLGRAYGERDARLVRRFAPNIAYESGEESIPVDYRRCRRRACADAPDDRDLDAHRSSAGARATVFVRVIRRGGRRYIQYWFYYPDSNTTFAGSDKVWERSYLLPLLGRVFRGSARYPGFHHDDWEGSQVRIDADGEVYARASSHRHYQGCKWSFCKNRWTPATGWTRVSRGSHAGHVPLSVERPVGGRRPRVRLRARYPGRDVRERTSTAEGLRLIPLEAMHRRSYRPRDPVVRPPWRKTVYRHPASDSS